MACVNCKERRAAHIQDKCLYGPARYMTKSRWQGVQWEHFTGRQARSWVCGHCGVSNTYVAAEIKGECRSHCRKCEACNVLFTE